MNDLPTLRTSERSVFLSDAHNVGGGNTAKVTGSVPRKRMPYGLE
jgi:hypothetical protein